DSLHAHEAYLAHVTDHPRPEEFIPDILRSGGEAAGSAHAVVLRVFGLCAALAGSRRGGRRRPGDRRAAPRPDQPVAEHCGSSQRAPRVGRSGTTVSEGVIMTTTMHDGLDLDQVPELAAQLRVDSLRASTS